MNFIGRLKLLGRKAFWLTVWYDFKDSLNADKELIKRKKYLELILDVLVTPLWFITVIVGTICSPTIAKRTIKEIIIINKRRLKRINKD